MLKPKVDKLKAIMAFRAIPEAYQSGWYECLGCGKISHKNSSPSLYCPCGLMKVPISCKERITKLYKEHYG